MEAGIHSDAAMGCELVGLDLDVLDANASVGMFVLDGLLVALSALLLDDLFELALGVLCDDRGDLDGGGGEASADMGETVGDQSGRPGVCKWEQRASGRIVGSETGEKSS